MHIFVNGFLLVLDFVKNFTDTIFVLGLYFMVVCYMCYSRVWCFFLFIVVFSPSHRCAFSLLIVNVLFSFYRVYFRWCWCLSVMCWYWFYCFCYCLGIDLVFFGVVMIPVVGGVGLVVLRVGA